MGTNQSRAVFDATAATYDRDRMKLIPGHEAFYAAALELIPTDAMSIVELGAGSGLFSTMLRAAFPEAHLTLIDFSENMLALARGRLGSDPQITFSLADYTIQPLPANCDAVVTSLSIHHLEDERKRALLQPILQALKPGGLFVNADHIAGPTANLEEIYQLRWLADVRALGSDGATDFRFAVPAAGGQAVAGGCAAGMDARGGFCRCRLLVQVLELCGDGGFKTALTICDLEFGLWHGAPSGYSCAEFPSHLSFKSKGLVCPSVRRLSTSVVVIGLFTFVTAISAQTSIYGTVAAADFGFTGNNYPNGVSFKPRTAGLIGGAFYTFPSASRFKAGIDGRVTFSPSYNGGSAYTGALRAGFVPNHNRLRPYFQIGGGVASTQIHETICNGFTCGVQTNRVTNGVLQLDFGLDIRATDHLDVRAFDWGADAGTSNGSTHAGTGSFRQEWSTISACGRSGILESWRSSNLDRPDRTAPYEAHSIYKVHRRPLYELRSRRLDGGAVGLLSRFRLR